MLYMYTETIVCRLNQWMTFKIVLIYASILVGLKVNIDYIAVYYIYIYILHRTLYTVYKLYTIYSIHCIVCSMHCTVYYTLYTDAWNVTVNIENHSITLSQYLIKINIINYNINNRF